MDFGHEQTDEPVRDCDCKRCAIAERDRLKEEMVKVERLSGHFAKYPQNPDTMAINLLSAIGTIAHDALTPNVQIEGQPASGLSLSNVGLG